MTETTQQLDLVVGVVREVLACDRAECTPEDHQRFVSENFRIARNDTDGSTR